MSKKHNNAIYLEYNWVKVSLLIGAFVFAYGRVMFSLIDTWARDDYSHGFLVPLISFYFVWTERNKLRQLPIQPNIFGGLVLTLMGALMLIMGEIGGVVIIQELSLIIVLPGLVMMIFGKKYLKALSLPLAYLILMVPILDEIIARIHWPFQLLSATIAAKLLEIFNIPLIEKAQYLELPNITLKVAEECSGIRYLISIVAVGIPLAYFTQKKKWKKTVLVIAAVIIAILSNGVRVGLIGLWSYYHQSYAIHGPFHVFQGFFVSMIGFIFLFIGAWFLNRFRS